MEEAINALIFQLCRTRSHTLRVKMVKEFEEEHGEIPERFKEAVRASVEVYHGFD